MCGKLPGTLALRVVLSPSALTRLQVPLTSHTWKKIPGPPCYLCKQKWHRPGNEVMKVFCWWHLAFQYCRPVTLVRKGAIHYDSLLNYLIRGLKFVLPYNPGKSGIRTVCPYLEQWGYGAGLSFLTTLGLEQWGYEDPSLSVLNTIVSLGLQKWGYGTWGNGTGK